MVALGDRLALLPLILTFLFYPPMAWLALKYGRPRGMTWPFVLVNIFGAYLACAATVAVHVFFSLQSELHILGVVGVGFLCYIAVLAINHALLKMKSGASGFASSMVFIFPVLMLVLIKYIPWVQSSFPAFLKPINVTHVSVLFLGLSYVTFRLIYLSQEVRNEIVPMPSLTDYLGFAFFVPTLSTGPISSYRMYIQSVKTVDRDRTPVFGSLLRILVGLTKYIFLATLLSQISYAGLLRDGHPHHKIDLAIAAFSYTLYLYCNFSGFCDMVIGISGVLGVEVMENFNQPFHARNFQEFWNRWHITLSVWLRDLLFTPLVKAIVRVFGPQSTSHAIAISIITAFFLIGIWHGVGVSFAIFGLTQGIGVASVHYYTLFIKRRLGKARYAQYRSNIWIRCVSTAMTFIYFSATLSLFANSWSQLRDIWKSIV